VNGYSGISILGRAAGIDSSCSERVLKPKVVDTGPRQPGFRGIYFEDDWWDGSDIFTVNNSGYLFCKSRVKDAISTLKPTNMEFTRLVEYER
jgi:hypothetical protein